MSLRAIDLFCGAGGFSLGFRAAGCEIVAAADADESAAETFKLNLGRLQPHAPPLVVGGEDEGNVEDLDLDRLASQGRPDILIGGPPCQGFSRIGRAKLDSLTEEGHVNDPRNELYRRFLDAAELWQPRAVVMENVPGMLSHGGRNVADDVAADLASRGYHVGYAILNAVWYGVPQYRERLFFIGIRQDLGSAPHMPATTHSASLPSGYVKQVTAVPMPLPFVQHFELPVRVNDGRPATTVWDAFADLPEVTGHLQEGSPTIDDTRTYKSAPHSPYARLMRSWPELTSSQVTHHTIRRTPRDYETFRRMNPGDRYPEALAIAGRRFHEELERLQASGQAPASHTPAYAALQRRYVPPYPVSKYVDKWRKLVPDQPSWTVPAHLEHDTYSHIHYDGFQARAVSIREAARLQSFPDAFEFIGNVGERFRQIGNAVPPLLSWVVAAAVLSCLRTRPEFPDWTALDAENILAIGS